MVAILYIFTSFLEEGDDDDDWTPHKAAGVCIMLLAQCVGDDIIPCVLPFFQHFNSNDWKYKASFLCYIIRCF